MTQYKLYAQKNNYYGKPTDKDLETACINSYSKKREDKKLKGLDFFSDYNYKSGLSADVYYNDDYLVVVFRGTEWSHINDITTDVAMGLKKELSQQFYDADRLWNRLQDNDMFPNREVIATGHSLGGSISVYLGNKYGDKVVAFCPYGIGDIVESRKDTSNITNYGNPNDPIFMSNHKNQIGNIKYVFNQHNYNDEIKNTTNAFKRFHLLENYGDINYATEDITGEKYLQNISKAYDTNRMSPEERLMYESISKQVTNNYYNSDNSGNCPGYVNVSSYTREGKEVSGYTRTCPYHGN